jgi:hypothetical protein
MIDDTPYFKAMAAALRRLLNEEMPYVQYATLTVVFVDANDDEHELTLSATSEGDEIGN